MAQSRWNLPHDSQLLSSKQDRLRHLIANGANEKQLLRMAAKVVASRIKGLRILRGQLVPCGGEELKNRYAELDARIDAIRAAGPMAVLDEFRRHKS